MKKHLGWVLIWLASALGACGQPQQQPLRIGTNLWTGYEFLYLARERGWFEPRQVHLVEFSSSSDVIRAFRNGNIDAATLTLDEVLMLAETGEDPRIVLVTDISAGSDVLLASLDIDSLADLRGRRVAVENTALGAYFLTRALEHGGLSADDIDLVALPYDQHESAFRRGSVDALVTFDPVRARLLATGARELFSSKQLPSEIVDVLAVRASAVEVARTQLKTAISSWFHAIDEFMSNPEATLPVMAKRHQMSVEMFQSTLNGIHLGDDKINDRLFQGEEPQLVETLRLVDRLMNRAGLLARPTDLERIIDAKPLQMALKDARQNP